MSKSKYENIKDLLASDEADEIHQGLELVRKDVQAMDQEELREMVEMVTSLFYIDLLDRPDLVPVVDEAVSLVAEFGERVIPLLVDTLDAGDLKAQLAIGHAMGRVGEIAIAPLIKAYRSTSDHELRIFILYALGKIDSPKIEKALDVVFKAAQDEHAELRDTATRVIGKFVESIPSGELSEEDKELILRNLRNGLSDERAGIRSKAVRSYGKLALYNHLDEGEIEELKGLCHRLLGSEEFNWDRAYIVRKEAREILDNLSD